MTSERKLRSFNVALRAQRPYGLLGTSTFTDTAPELWNETCFRHTGYSINTWLCESRGLRPGLPVLNMPYRFCARKTPWKKKKGHDDPPTQIFDGDRSCTLQFLCIYVGLLYIESMQWKISLYVYYDELLWVVYCADQPNDTDTGSSGKNIRTDRQRNKPTWWRNHEQIERDTSQLDKGSRTDREKQTNLMKRSRTDRYKPIWWKNHERTEREKSQLDEEITNGQRYKPIWWKITNGQREKKASLMKRSRTDRATSHFYEKKSRTDRERNKPTWWRDHERTEIQVNLI